MVLRRGLQKFLFILTVAFILNFDPLLFALQFVDSSVGPEYIWRMVVYFLLKLHELLIFLGRIRGIRLIMVQLIFNGCLNQQVSVMFMAERHFYKMIISQ